MRIEADNLEIAYKDAVSKLQCSITQLDIKLIQSPNKGFLGFFKKNAIIEVSKIENESKFIANEKDSKPKKFNLDKAVIDEIKFHLEDLFCNECFRVTDVVVKKLSEELVYIEFHSEDDENLIGKDGSGFRSLSFMIYGWISLKYCVNVKFNIGDYLNSQEKNIQEYLKVIIEKVQKETKVSTKILDNQSIKIALSTLRQKFPNKFVGIKTSSEGKYILIKDFKEKQ